MRAPIADLAYPPLTGALVPSANGLPADRANAILEGIGEAIVVIDRVGRVTWWNAAAERTSGVRREEIVGRPLVERFPVLHGSRVERELRDALDRRAPREYRGWRYGGAADGAGAGVYDIRLWPLADDSLLLLFTEVSAREAQRTELEARIREIVQLRDFARAMAGVADSTALLRLLCGAAVEHLHGMSAIVVRDLEDGTGQCLAAAGAGTTLEGSRFPLAGSLIERVLHERQAVVLDEYSSESRHFQRVAADQALGPIAMVPLIAHGERLGVLGVARRRGDRPFSDADLQHLGVFVDHASLATWKARLLERAESANEAKANFLASMSHELRTPLTALTGYGELLADQILGPLDRGQLDVVERMRSVTHHLSALIDELLTYSSLEAGREHARLRVVELVEIVEEAVLVVEPLARQKEVLFYVDAPTALPAVRTDGDKVRQILVNLIGNAIKFTDVGEVRLSFTCPADEVRFVVRDTGVGIAPEDQHRLFHPFAQLDGGLTRRHGGTGLGLYISRRLAELLGGRIELESQLGQGATFTLVLPRE